MMERLRTDGVGDFDIIVPSTFPPYPALVDRIDIFARMITAKEVGGDFYDFYFAGKNRLALVIADVSGKGVPAALFMMRAKAMLQGCLKSGLGIAEAVERTNHRLSTRNDSRIQVRRRGAEARRASSTRRCSRVARPKWMRWRTTSTRRSTG